MLWLNQETDCLRRPAQTLPAKVRPGKKVCIVFYQLCLS